MSAPDVNTAAAPGGEVTGPSVQLPVVDIRMQEFALPPVPDLGELTGIRIPPLPTPAELFEGLPPLPPLDLTALVQPLLSHMQLLGSGIINGPWGTGDVAGGGGVGGGGLSGLFDLSRTLTESLSTGSSALNALGGQWQGEGSDTAKVTGEQIEADKKAVKAQGEQIASTVRVGAGIINHGNLLLKSVASQLATTLAALAPTSVTPAGQAAMVSAIAAATAEAEAIIAATEMELLPPTNTLVALSQPVPVRMPPGAEMARLQKVTQMAQEVMGPVEQAMQMVSGPTDGTGLGDLTGDATSDLDPYSSGLPFSTDYATDGAGGAGSNLDALYADDLSGAWAADATGGMGAGGVGGSSGLGAAALLGAAGTMGAAGAMGAMAGGAEAAPAAAARAATSGAGQPAMMPPPPMGGAGAAGRGGDDDSHKVPDFLVTAAHGDEVIGEQPDVAPGVVGGSPHPGDVGRPDDDVDSTHLNI